MQKQETQRASDDEQIVPLEDLQHIFEGNRALRRKFLSNLRRRVKASRRAEKKAAPSHD